MKHSILSLLVPGHSAKARTIKAAMLLTGTLAMGFANNAKAQRPDTMWVQYDNRFQDNKVIPLKGYDTLRFQSSMIQCIEGETGKKKNVVYPTTSQPGTFYLKDPGRILYCPNSMRTSSTTPYGFNKTSSRWCFERSKESEHFVCFWEDGASFDVDAMLKGAELSWKCYTEKLGFVKVGQSSTDKYKIVMRVYNTTDWVASGSGEDMKVGTLNLCPWALSSRGGATVAHEIGHTFQYLTNVDCGANNTHGFNYGLGDNGAGGNGFWEDCANWMAYKVYPSRQFTDGEYFEGYMARHHQNIMHEDSRYHNCFYQDFLCDKFGQDFIGRLWREANRPEDPVDAIMRLQGLDNNGFAALMYDVFSHMCTWDTPSIRTAAKNRIGAHPQRLEMYTTGGKSYYRPKPEYCPQNYGYNISELAVPDAGTEISIDLQSLVGNADYRQVNTAQAGWRWGLVFYKTDGTTEYGDMQSGTGILTTTVPEKTKRMWIVVMGAPKKWWHHLWDDNASNDEQWPYSLEMNGTTPLGVYKTSFQTYTEADFPEDYQRRDTTINITCNLTRDASNYTSVNVQYDMDAISEALGLTTAQLKAMKVGSGVNPHFVGISSTGNMVHTTTTSTSSSSRLGHWFTTTGNVCSYNSTAAIFAELLPDSWVCQVGQYPGRLTSGKSYTIRQGVTYKHTDGRTYVATIVVKVNVQ